MVSRQQIRIGVLGAARIVPTSLIRPAAKLSEVTVAAIAARDQQRARRFADQHGVERVHRDYESLIEDPDLDAVYIALPNSHHAIWSERALRAGKHVLCEKPLAASAEEAARVAHAAAETGLVLCEAMHYRFHPVAKRIKQIVNSGQLGRIERVEAFLCVPPIAPGNIRLKFELAGGATMDLGCYLVDVLRFLTEEEPKVTSAKAARASDQIDRWMQADFEFPSGCTGHTFCSLRSLTVWKTRLNLYGDAGNLCVSNPFLPHLFGHRLDLQNGRGEKQRERLTKEPTYDFQLLAFRDAVIRGTPLPFDVQDALANLRVIDEIYQKAGMLPRGGQLV